MTYLLSPKVDFVFKRIFGNEKHPEILISFLNAVMKPKDLIESVQIRNSDIEKEHIEDKYSRLDIKAITNKGEYINIEIQVKNEYNMIKRSLYYWSKMFENQIVEGDNYNKLAKTVCINILDFKYLRNEKFHNVYRLKEIITNEELTDTMELHFIEIPKLRKLDDSEEISDMLEAWVAFIQSPDSEVVEKLEMSKKEIKEAKSELVRMSGDSKERYMYEKRKESILEKVSLIENAEQKGIEKGENKKAIEIAKNAINNNLDDNTIKIITGLSLEEIKELRNKK
ncbi:Rpn family recombination-promoting nuclease/putative transposase [Clostridium perfringens]|uniref:Rpn family recombination-promoting nuclease/putative transposase n=1 Tax=Clostridium perfringens TaxID=1502 RepID=UPI0028CE22BE|nr:Rpn family recombination-promoting nuclease/putative transposase [Clostridium perfringens]MDT7918857.1 Rpn family recombination-promoting nuclease/putative transposase [Clostridium perfringens]MDT7927863.1 Rpn family recombination-promoting nuclease/putative transposase [Clostridium perfringens]MDT7938426.1 Rpn family recombination-promoting nuclease/putative transposase [Clostridium perfringens]MDT8012358.1 Rpn family recombination-promoting nuclease/putative transposase [Clostridium perfri